MFLLVDADPVDIHQGGEGGGIVGAAGPFAADGDVEEKVVGLMEFLHGVGGDVGGVDCFAVEAPDEVLVVPLEFEDVEVFCEHATGEFVVLGAHGLVAVVLIVEVDFDGAIISGAVEFKDVDFAAFGPAGGAADFIAVCAEHPEGGPDALAVGELDAGGDFAVLPGLFAAGVESGGGVLLGAVGVAVMDGFEDEVAVFEVGVFLVVEVLLPLVVVGFGEDLAGPVVGVEGLALEFIGPDEAPVAAGLVGVGVFCGVNDGHGEVIELGVFRCLQGSRFSTGKEGENDAEEEEFEKWTG